MLSSIYSLYGLEATFFSYVTFSVPIYKIQNHHQIGSSSSD